MSLLVLLFGTWSNNYFYLDNISSNLYIGIKWVLLLHIKQLFLLKSTKYV